MAILGPFLNETPTVPRWTFRHFGVRFGFFFQIRLTSMVLKRDSMAKHDAPQIIDSIVTSSSRRSRDWFLMSKLRTFAWSPWRDGFSKSPTFEILLPPTAFYVNVR